MGGRKSMAAIPIGESARDVLVGCNARGNRKKYTAVLLAVVDYTLFGIEPGRASGVDDDLWSALKGEVDRIRSGRKAAEDAGSKGGRPPKETKTPTEKHLKANESEEKQESTLLPEPKANATEERRVDEIREECVSGAPAPAHTHTHTRGAPTDEERRDFGEFWDAYPWKQGREDVALLAWVRAVREHGLTLGAALSALNDQTAAGVFDEDRLSTIPWPMQWLSQRMWANRFVGAESAEAKKMAAASARDAVPDSAEERYGSVVTEVLSDG